MIRLAAQAKTLAISSAAAVALGFGTGWTANGWRLNGKIAEIRQQESDNRAAGWQRATEILQAERAAADRAIRAAQAAEQRLRRELAERTQHFTEATQEPGECAEQASQPLVCPRPW